MKTMLKHISTSLVIALTTLTVTGCSNASTTQTQDTQTVVDNTVNNNQEVVNNLQTHLSNSGVTAKVISAIPTQVEGLYWVQAEDMPPFYTDTSGKHIIQGQIIDITGKQPVDISAQFTEQLAKKELANIAKEDMVIFPATTEETKAVIYAFTDPTCPFCQKLHKEIEQTNAKGIEVRYLAWPRNQKALPIMQNIWCSADKKQALTDAKEGKAVQAPTCDSSIIKEQIALGLSLGIQGTPAIFTEDGKQIGGYLSPTDIAKKVIN